RERNTPKKCGTDRCRAEPGLVGLDPSVVELASPLLDDPALWVTPIGMVRSHWVEASDQTVDRVEVALLLLVRRYLRHRVLERRWRWDVLQSPGDESHIHQGIDSKQRLVACGGNQTGEVSCRSSLE